MANKRYFNTSGPNIPSEHYTLARKELIGKGLEMVRNSRYFTIWAPRQTGKSTYFRMLAVELEKEGYKVCHINVENYATIPLSSFLEEFVGEMQKAWKISLTGTDLAQIFYQIKSINDEKLVLIIDEVEGINAEYLNIFLHSIRSAYHTRSAHCLKSVILVGVTNITGIIQDNASPFNANDNLEVPYFSKEETFALLAQHETESGQLFEPKVIEKLYHITAGQPGLVNGFALRMTTIATHKSLIDYEDYLTVEDWFLYKSLDKNVGNIVNKAKQYQAFVEKLLFKEGKVPFSVYSEQIRYLHINGLLKEDEDGNVEFWVPLYKKCLQQYFYPIMNGEADQIQGGIHILDYFMADGSLNWDKIMRGYQEYAARRGFRYFIKEDENGKPIGMLEAGLMYSFETYIQSFLQVMKGKSYLEPGVALGRSDLAINIRGNEAVIEGKIYHNITQFVDGKAQLAYYIKGLGLTKGIYLVFVNAIFNHPEVVESIEMFENIELTTYLVKYDVDKDFSAPRKKREKRK